jgi:ABC-type antimicrobial peptide transport system permease subunit
MERTAEIVLRRAIGATRWHVAAQFLVKSASMGFIGGIIGARLGVTGVNTKRDVVAMALRGVESKWLVGSLL